MSFRIDKDQPKYRNPNQVRYIFRHYEGGKNHRKLVTCTRSEVEKIYIAWVTVISDAVKESKAYKPPIFETFMRYLDEYCVVKKSPKQYAFERDVFEKYLKRYFENVPVASIRRVDIESFILWMKQQPHRRGMLAPGSINRKIAVVQSFFSWCIKKEFYERLNPCSGMKLPEDNERHVHLDPDEIREIIERAKNSSRDLHVAVMIALYTGMRRSEIAALRWFDIDFTRQRINIRSATTKTKKFRSVPMPDALKGFLEALEKKDERVLQVKADCITHRFYYMQKSLSFRRHLDGNMHFHDLRHVFAQTLRDAGVSLDDIQSFLGHSSPVITHRRYAQSGGHDGVRKVNRLAAFIEGGSEQEISRKY